MKGAAIAGTGALIAVYFILAVESQVFGQNPEVRQLSVYKSVSTPPITAFATDKKGGFYLAFNSGTLVKYDSSAIERLRYSPKKAARISQVQAWSQLRVILFYRSIQSIVVLDRFLAETATFDLSRGTGGFVRLACQSQDNAFWLLDESFQMLLKYDPLAERIAVRIPLSDRISTENQVTGLTEHQNILYASLEKGGFARFDMSGNFLGILDTATPVQEFSFSGDYVVYTDGDELVYSALYGTGFSSVKLPEAYDLVFDADNYKVGIKKEGGFDLLR